MSPRFWLSLLLTTLLWGCSLLPEQVDKTKGWSAQKLYSMATEAMHDGDYTLAIEYYEKLEARYPFGQYATAAQLNLAYAHYKDAEPESAILAADRFIKLHPDHPALPYAYYFKGLVNFNRNFTLLDRFLPTDTAQRDAGAAIDSYRDFAALVSRYPNTEYAEDAHKRMLYLRNNLARGEVVVARYYLKRGAFLAAANRAQYVVENYQKTPAVREALLVMVEAYGELGMEQLQNDAQRVLALNDEKGNFVEDVQKDSDQSLMGDIWQYLELDKD